MCPAGAPSQPTGTRKDAVIETIVVYKGRFEEALSDLILDLQRLPMKERASISWRTQNLGARFVHGLDPQDGQLLDLPLFHDHAFIEDLEMVITGIKSLEKKDKLRIMDKIRYIVDLARALGIKFQDMGVHPATSFVKNLPEIGTMDYE